MTGITACSLWLLFKKFGGNTFTWIAAAVSNLVTVTNIFQKSNFSPAHYMKLADKARSSATDYMLKVAKAEKLDKDTFCRDTLKFIADWGDIGLSNKGQARQGYTCNVKRRTDFCPPDLPQTS